MRTTDEIIETIYRINKRGCEMFRTTDYQTLLDKWAELKGNPKYTRQYRLHIRNRREHTDRWDVHWTEF